MNKNFDNNGHKYIDLDLPSGTLWATMNVGANKPSDFGLYFQWGDTKGWTKDQIGKDKQFNWANYKWYDTVGKTLTKYTTKGATLELEDDAAHIIMKGDWHIPTVSQIKELLDNTTSTWTTQDGVNGRLFTSKKNGNSIFIPYASYAWNGSVRDIGDLGSVWSSMLNPSNVGYGQYLYFISSGVHLNYGNYRCLGLSVRGVIG